MLSTVQAVLYFIAHFVGLIVPTLVVMFFALWLLDSRPYRGTLPDHLSRGREHAHRTTRSTGLDQASRAIPSAGLRPRLGPDWSEPASGDD